MTRWIKEPLLHFVVLGALIFVVYSLVNTSEDNDRKIVIDDDRLKHINALYEIQWDRPATPEELRALVEIYIRQEVLYREALRMNLDHNDEVVKRRLSQKMEFISSDLTKMVEPITETKLQAYFEENKEDYRVPTAYSFSHILLSNQNHINPKEDASKLLASVDVAQYESLIREGDQTTLSLSYKDASGSMILKELGAKFYSSLDTLPLSQWTGPISSGFGIHLVFISNKTNTHIPELAEVKNKVVRDYEYATEIATRDAVYNELKKNYEVIIELDDLNQSEKNKLYANLKLQK
ncbi:peptidyl-prolyl cis-trans isomerase [Galbibacter mesophilus]|uniref:peptidylprolyl isomerase n=1 Tax=Galbibacter mesophilus TaxID=379069 RepID=UPI00191CCFE1|nr:peptidylprolyl isomerase [Galbibacter mesophilus]MCM5662492.1 peptidylprolyl isomerase [Galbibacter mesophilus]